MNKIWILLLTAMSILSANVTEIKDPYKDIDYFILDNGLQVYMLSNEKATNTNISMKINVGWDIENDENYGLSHLVEHMIFRDKRVPHRDYLDYMKEEGASYVNGYTSRYDTELVAKIDSNKSYWITELFAQMIFDKDINSEDIEIEKGAVQVEIGEKVWYEVLISSLSKIKDIYPPNDSIYNSHFGLKKPKELPDGYTEKVNNTNFTLQEVMQHYDKYYYPANMILKVTGNYDTAKMKEHIQRSYGKINKMGTERTYKPKRDAILSHKEYVHHREGVGRNYGYIGTQYLFDDCQKHIILNAFVKFVSTKIQQQLRNKEGKSYTVSTYSLQSRGAGVVAVSFDGLHDDFDNNIKIVRNNIQNYVKNIDDSMIKEALDEYKKRYTSIEFDSGSLSSLVNKAEHMRSDHKIDNKTHFDFFKSITPAKFKEVVSEAFIPQNSYNVIYRDYYWFTGDVNLMSILILFIIIYLYFAYNHLIFAYRGVKYLKREVLLSHRIGNRFAGFVIFVFIVLFTGFIYTWLKYFAMKYIMGNADYLYTLDVPYGLYSDIVNNILSIILMFAIYRWLIVYHSRIDITNECMYILGSKPISIAKKNVKSIEVVPWTINKLFHTTGFAFFFWRPLLKLETDSKIYYLRSSHAKALKEDLMHRWIDQV